MATALFENPKENRLLAMLPPLVYARVEPHLRFVSCLSEDAILDAHKTIDAIYFPTTCTISLVHADGEGNAAGVGLIGTEGVVGVDLFLGGEVSIAHALVQMAGVAWRMEAQAVREEFGRAAAFQRILLRYTNAFLTQISIVSGCHRLHTLEQRLCWWLLMSDDRAKSGDLKLTQKLLSSRLGVRREGITLAAGHLQQTGLIKYHRGEIMIQDRAGLENCACECYRLVKDEYERLLGTR